MPWALDPQTLETLGEWNFDGQIDSATFTAHPKLDPVTGNLLAFSYEAKGDGTPDMAYFEISPEGKLLHEIWFQAPYAAMATLPEEELVRRIRDTDALVVMKIGRNLAKLRRVLAAAGRLPEAWLVEHGTMPAERVRLLAEVGEEAPYFSIAIIHGKGRRP